MVVSIITVLLLITIFAITIAKMIKNNFSEYIVILVLEFIGIVINFGAVILKSEMPLPLLAGVYIVSVMIPIAILLLERKSIYPSELILYMPWKTNIDRGKILAILDKHPESYEAHKRLAKYYVSNKETERAQSEFCELIELRPKEYENYCILAKLYVETGKNDNAIQTLNELLKQKPDYTEASILYSKILFDSEKFKEAVLVLRDALKYNPKEYELYYLLGMTYTRLNDFNNAKENYKKAATINSYKDISNLSIGQIYLIFEEYDKAEEYFYKVLQSDDEFISANGYYNLAKIKLMQNNETQAIQYANLALECNPKLLSRMEQDELFMIILSKLNVKSANKMKTNIKKREEDTLEHLGKTFNVVETLTNNYTINGKNKERDFD